MIMTMSSLGPWTILPVVGLGKNTGAFCASGSQKKGMKSPNAYVNILTGNANGTAFIRRSGHIL